jgi:hypothetical protein
MMKVKTSDLAGAALDWAVEYIEGGCKHEPHANYWLERWVDPERRYLCESASTDWAQCGPVIEREKITLSYVGEDQNESRADMRGGPMCYGPTQLIAAMRCYVASKLGDEIELPEELE